VTPQCAQVIRREKTEVLLDLTTYGDFTGAHILQHLPAPVQVGFLGYPGPKVAPFINSSLWDRAIQPPELSVPGVWGAERLVYSSVPSMPSSHSTLFGRAPKQCAGGDRGAEQVRTELGVSANATALLCNLAQTWKIDANIFGVWMTVLREQLPDAELMLWQQSSDTYRNLARGAQAHGVDPARCVWGVSGSGDVARLML
jgi:protein O-GlcNAc transferase